MYDVFQQYLDLKITLAEEEKERIQSVSILKKLRKKQYLLQEGDIWKYDAFITKGCLLTYFVDDKGLEHVVGFGIENWWIGDRESLLSGAPSKFNIDAIEDSEIALFTHANFEALCAEIPAFNTMINGILQRSFITSQNRILSAISNTAEGKYLHFINQNPEFALRVPQSMIASFLGMTPETLSRVRNQVMKK